MSHHPENITMKDAIKKLRVLLLQHPEIPTLVFSLLNICLTEEEVELVWAKMLQEKLLKKPEIKAVISCAEQVGISLPEPLEIKLIEKILGRQQQI